MGTFFVTLPSEHAKDSVRIPYAPRFSDNKSISVTALY
jgi:hypothetical protein